MKIHKKDYQHIVLVGEDRVFASAPIAMQGGRFLGAWGQVQAVAQADINIAVAVMMMARGMVVIHPNPEDTTWDADEIWDALVPKDELHSLTAGIQQIDTDIAVGDEETATFSEPGVPNPTIIAQGDSIWGQRVFDYEEVMTFSKTSDGFKDATPDTYIPNTIFGVQASQRVQMDDVPGYVLFALGRPALTQTTATVAPLLAGREWLMLRHLTRLIDEAWMQFAGLDEAGAESPFVDIAALIEKLTEPDVQEESSGAWGAASFNCWSTMNIITEVPRSNVVPSTLTSG